MNLSGLDQRILSLIHLSWINLLEVNSIKLMLSLKLLIFKVFFAKVTSVLVLDRGCSLVEGFGCFCECDTRKCCTRAASCVNNTAREHELR